MEEMGAVTQAKGQEIMLEQVAARGGVVAALSIRSEKMLMQHLPQTHSPQSRVFCNPR
jgi:hypothetical protein